MSIDNVTPAEWDEIARMDAENIKQLERLLDIYKGLSSTAAAIKLHRLGVRCAPEMLQEQGE